MRQLWFACYCHGVISSASCLFDDHDWNIAWSVKNVICLLLSRRNCLDRIVMASETIVIYLLLSWRDSFSKLSVWWSWLWNIAWSVKNVICLLLSWRNCLDRIVMASEAIVICLILSWRDSFSELSARWLWLWNVVWREAREPHTLVGRVSIFSVSPQCCSLFSASFQTFFLTVRAYLNTQ